MNKLNIKRKVSWRVFRRYQQWFKGRLMTKLTNEDDIAYLTNKEGEIIAWVRLIVPKSYA